MNILFTTSAAPSKSPFFTSEKRPPLGLGTLISIARNKGHGAFFIDNYLSPSRFIEKGFLQENDIDIVAIHANTICFRDTLRMLNAIEDLRKRDLWRGKMIVGGPHTSVAVETIPEFVDHVVQGEGEKALEDILSGRAESRIIRGERITDLDSLPSQPWDIFTKLPYDYQCKWIDEAPVFTINTSRGCPFNCTFCSVSSVWGKRYSFLSADRIISEIEYLIENHNAKGIYFREDHFTLNTNRTREFCEKLIVKNIDISWACETRVDVLSEELIELMSRAGCRAFYLGVESGSQNVLDKLRKDITLEQIENVSIWSNRYSVRTYWSLIVGTPHDTFKDYIATKRLIKKLKPYSHAFNVYVGIPGSSLYKYISRNNLYEYKDDIGLLYLPGFDVKTKYFYGANSKKLVDYRFRLRTPFDKRLLKRMWRVPFRILKNRLSGFIKKIASPR
ncbi:MAG: radical SAM protein [Candidatus Krumholzibacteriota bacterium]|nr:radical SAM protein [Candidatus Krumholzibacteriota bacterium]